MLQALQWTMTPPSLVVLGGVLAAVAAFARLFRRPAPNSAEREDDELTSSATPIGQTGPDGFDAFLASLGNDVDGD